MKMIELAVEGADLGAVISQVGTTTHRKPFGVTLQVGADLEGGQGLLRAWRKLSAELIRSGCVEVVVHCPMQKGELAHVPGLFGQPGGVGEVGDHHWSRQSVVPLVDNKGAMQGVQVVLARRRTAPGSGVHLREEENVIMVITERVGPRRHIGHALAVVGGVGIPEQVSRDMPNPLPAAAWAAVEALEQVPDHLDVVVVAVQPLTWKSEKPGIDTALAACRRTRRRRSGLVRVLQRRRGSAAIMELMTVWAARRMLHLAGVDHVQDELDRLSLEVHGNTLDDLRQQRLNRDRKRG